MTQKDNNAKIKTINELGQSISGQAGCASRARALGDPADLVTHFLCGADRRRWSCTFSRLLSRLARLLNDQTDFGENLSSSVGSAAQQV